MAGQFAKPRSSDTETQGGVTPAQLPGRHHQRTGVHARRAHPDPGRMEFGYFQSAGTLNLLRAFASGGYADLHEVHRWNLGFVERSPLADRYRDLAARIDETLAFMTACGMTSATTRDLRETDFYISHEALLLPYEQALTRVEFHLRRVVRAVPRTSSGSAIAPVSSDGAHVEFLRGVRNPIGMKVGPTQEPDELVRIIEIAEPAERAGPDHADQPHGRR